MLISNQFFYQILVRGEVYIIPTISKNFLVNQIRISLNLMEIHYGI